MPHIANLKASEAVIPTRPPTEAAAPRDFRIAFFGHDTADSAIAKRVRSFQAHGAEVQGFMFERARAKAGGALDWPNVNLGVTVDGNYLKRLPKLAIGAAKALRRAPLLRRCDIFFARNLDMLFIAVIIKALTRSRAKIVYEALDVRSVFLGKKFVNKLFRFGERRLLASTSLLVVSAPDYIEHYFKPVQNYGRAWRLLENKLEPSAAEKPNIHPGLAPHPPWVVGVFGVLKCARSQELLYRLAEELGDRITIYIRGIPSENVPLHSIEAACRRLPNVLYGGPYRHPDDLPEIYGKIHMIWAGDFMHPGGNSDWCLANRIYEGGYYGAVLLAVKDTAIGRMTEREGLGYVFAEPLEETVAAFLQTLEAGTFAHARALVQKAPRSLFVDEADTRRLLQDLRDLCFAAEMSTKDIEALS